MRNLKEKTMKKTYTRIVHLVMLMNLFFASALPASVVAVEQLESTTSQETTTASTEATTETSQSTEQVSETTVAPEVTANTTEVARVRNKRDTSAVGKNSVKISTSTGAEDWPLSMRVGEVALDAQGLTGTLTDSYIDIRYEGKYIDTFKVGNASFIKNVEYLTEGNDRIARVHLKELDSTTSVTFSYTMNFKKGLTPKGYEVSANVSWKDQDGTVIKEATGDATFRVKTLDMNVLKLPGNDYYSYDGTRQYGGTSNANGYIDNPEYVLFKFRADFNHEGTWHQRNRLMEKIVVTDTLPTYTDEQGNTRTAQFDASKNPGWTDNGDGTVSYTITADNMQEANALNQLAKLELYLKFPGAKTGDKDYYLNHVKVDWHPFNETPADQKSAEDDVTIRLRPNLFPGNFTVKRGENKLKIREGSNHDMTKNSMGTYLIEMNNQTPYPITELTIEDKDLDPQLFFYSIKALYGPSEKVQFFAVDKDGNETEIAPEEVVDKAAVQQNKDTAAKVQSGEITKEQAPQTQQTIKKIIIRLKDGKQIDPNEGFTFRMHVSTGVLYDNASLLNKDFPNTAKFTGKLLTTDSKEIPFNSEHIGKIQAEELAIKIGLAKTTTSNDTGAVDEVVEYNISADFFSLPSVVEFENPRFIDLLPEGIKFEELKNSNIPVDVEVIDNYNDSNRQAVIFKLKEKVEPTKLAYPKITFKARITAEATPSSVDTFKKNENRVYFVTDKESIDDKTFIQLNSKGEVDEYDVNGNGDKTERLVGARSNTIVTVPTQIRSEKLIKKDTDTVWNKTLQLMDYEENFKYRLRTVNNTNETFRHFVLYDKLPVKGDVHGFANIVTGPVVAPSGFKVYYNTGSDLPDNPAEGVNAAGWVENVDDYSKVTALKIVMVNPEVIEPGEDINFDVPMKSPAYEESGELNGKISSNTYYVNRDAADLTNFGVSNTVQNQLPQYFLVKKDWKNRSSEVTSITMELYRESEPDKVVATIELNEENGWKGTLKKTSKDTIIDPNIKDWKVREKLPENYGDDYEGSQEKSTQGFYVLNKRAETQHTVEKTWNDNEDKLGLRAPITVQLKQNGVAYGTPVTLNAANGWKYTFTGLPKSLNGKAYEYTVDEISVPAGYYNEVKTEDGKTTITNHLVDPVKVDLIFTKKLEGRSIVDGEFTFNLLNGDGEVLATTTAQANGTITFKDVTFEKAGTYKYKVVEVAGTDETIQYDSTQKEVTITVTQDGNAYVASVAYPEEKAFQNTYTPPTTTTEEPPVTTTEEPPVTTTEEPPVTTTEEPPVTTEVPPTPKQPGLPNTGTESGVVAFVVALMSTVAGLVVLTKKKEMNA